MDESKSSIPPIELRLPSASGRTPADIDPPPVAMTKSDQSVAVYDGNAEEVSRGFLIALKAMGVTRSADLLD